MRITSDCQNGLKTHEAARWAFAVARPWRALMFCLPAVLLLAGLMQLPARAAGKVPFWSEGKTQVFSILDRPGGADISLFSGPAGPEERERYFRDGKAPSSVNVFLIRIDGKNILVDTGFGTVRPGKSELIPTLDAMGLAPQSIDIVILTHMHMDHAGGLLLDGKRAFPKANIMVSKPELDYWLELGKKQPDNPNAALVKSVVEAYGGDILPPFAFEQEILPGVTALDASGHTPGHTAFLVRSAGQSLLIIGDLIHAAALQFPLPEECARYDIDREKAVRSRMAILNMAAEKGLPIAGMHIPYPGQGGVAKAGKGFAFTPASEKN